MKRILISGLVAAATASAFAVSGGAGAASTDQIHGGCFFDTNSQATATNGSYVGVIGDHSVTTTGATPPAPIGATVTCTITVNGAGVVTKSYGDVGGVAGVQAGSDQISFTAADNDLVALCETVNYADGTSTGPDCSPSTSLQIPPQQVIDALDTVFNTLDDAQKTITDPIICPALASHAGSYGPITIDSTGDVTGPDPLDLGLNPYFDCPPYIVTP